MHYSISQPQEDYDNCQFHHGTYHTCHDVNVILYDDIHAPYQVTCKRTQETNDDLVLVETYRRYSLQNASNEIQ